MIEDRKKQWYEGLFFGAMLTFLCIMTFSLLWGYPLPNAKEDILGWNYCTLGCIGGLNYNGSEIVEIDVTDITDEDLRSFQACEQLCDVAVDKKIIESERLVEEVT